MNILEKLSDIWFSAIFFVKAVWRTVTNKPIIHEHRNPSNPESRDFNIKVWRGDTGNILDKYQNTNVFGISRMRKTYLCNPKYEFEYKIVPLQAPPIEHFFNSKQDYLNYHSRPWNEAFLELDGHKFFFSSCRDKEVITISVVGDKWYYHDNILRFNEETGEFVGDYQRGDRRRDKELVNRRSRYIRKYKKIINEHVFENYVELKMKLNTELKEVKPSGRKLKI
jgi:hypothetical protein